MEKSYYDNPIRKQIYSLPELGGVQAKNLFSMELVNMMSMAEIFDARNIILTGCGDSYAAALATEKIFKKYGDVFTVNTVRTIELSRFLKSTELGGNPHNPLVIVISSSGGSARILEAIERANKFGALTLLITNNPESRAAQAAQRLLVPSTPEYPESNPGLRSYFASLMSLTAIANRMGTVRGVLTPTSQGEWSNEMVRYAKSYAPILDQIDTKMFEIAKRWSKYEYFDFVGDESDYATAFFGAAKFIECFGGTSTCDDSENWCHINFFLKNPDKIGTVVIADKNLPGFSRVKETIGQMKKINRDVLVVTNADEEEFKELGKVEICSIPETTKGYEFIWSLMSYVPTTLLTGYLAKLKNQKYFRAGEEYGKRWVDSLTINSSNIEII